MADRSFAQWDAFLGVPKQRWVMYHVPNQVNECIKLFHLAVIQQEVLKGLCLLSTNTHGAISQLAWCKLPVCQLAVCRLPH